MSKLKGKNVLVTGGGSGIGKAIVEEFSELGANVAIHYHSSKAPAEELTESVRATGGKAFAFGADLTDEPQVKRMLEKVADEFNGLDVLVNNAGDLVARHNLENMELEFFRKVQAINVDSMMLVTREAIGMMSDRGGASIVNLSSLAGRKGGGGGSLAYSTTKGAILTWTRHLAVELAPRGIRVNAVAPGLILGSKFHQIHTPEESQKAAIATIPVGRAGACEDVARAVAFLASEYDGFITGATLDVNGGVYCA